MRNFSFSKGALATLFVLAISAAAKAATVVMGLVAMFVVIGAVLIVGEITGHGMKQTYAEAVQYQQSGTMGPALSAFATKVRAEAKARGQIVPSDDEIAFSAVAYFECNGQNPQQCASERGFQE